MWQFDTSPSTHTSGSADSSSSRMRAVSSLTFQVRCSGIKLKSDVWLMALSAEMIYNPQQQTQNHAQQNARHHRKITTAISPLVRNVAGQTPQPERQFSTKYQQRAHASHHNPQYNQKLSGFAKCIHGSALYVPF